MIRIRRRHFLQIAAGAATSPIISHLAFGQTWPVRPVRIIIGTPPGGPIDMSARLMGQWLSERLGQTFVVENRPGAGGNIGTEAVVRSAPDGYTLLLTAASAAINATLFDKLSFDFLRDMAPIASVNRIPLALIVHPAFPAKSVLELIAHAKANPGKVNMASPGNGTAPHVASELFKMLAGVDMVPVPYRGSGPMLTDLLGAHVQVAFDSVASSIEHVRAGKLRALAVATEQRLDVMPDIPTLSDTISGFEASGWCGICAPRNTPAEIVDRLNAEINAGLADPKVKARLADLGTTPFVSSPEAFGKFIANETEKWAKVIRFAKIQPD